MSLSSDWHQRDVVRMAWSAIPDPRYVLMLARSGFDATLLDAQHGFADEASIQACIHAAALARQPLLVRIPLERWDMVSRVLDFGAAGVVAPMINSVEEARQLVEVSKFLPLGGRSFGPRHCAPLWGMDAERYVQEANRVTLCLAMIETAAAIDAVDDILAVEGLDGVFIGPADFSIAVRQNPVPDPFGPDTRSLIAAIGKRCRDRGKWFGAYTAKVEDARWVREQGGNLISIGDDNGFLELGTRHFLEGFEA